MLFQTRTNEHQASTKPEALLSSSRPSLALENPVFESPVPTRSRFGKRS